jgi:hypothetical protein
LLLFKGTPSGAIITATTGQVFKKDVKKNKKASSDVKTNKLAVKKYFFYCYGLFPYTI